MTKLRTILVAGASIELRASDDLSRRHLDWFFGASPTWASAPELIIEVDDGADIARPSGPPTRRDGPILRWEDPVGLRLWHQAGAGGLVTASSITIGRGARDHRWRATRQLLFSALSWWFARDGGVLLHGAMVGRQGEALVLTGSTGRGKSTLGLAALVHGWELASDDLVILGRNPADLKVFGLPKRPTVAPEIARQVPVGGDLIPDDHRKRVMLPSSVLTVGWRSVRAVVDVGHHSGIGAIERLDHADALAVVLASSLESAEAEALRLQLPPIAALAARPAFRLLHAAEHDDRLDRAAALLEEVWSRSG